MTTRWGRLTGLAALATAGLALMLAGCAWGVVTDAQTGQPIVGAQVTFQDSKGGTGSVTSGAGGLYAFDAATGQAIPATGPVTYQVTASGYQPLTAQRNVQYDDYDQGIWEIQSFALSRSGGPSPPPVEGFQLVVDVNPTASGVQTSRTVPLSSSSFRVDIVLANPPRPLGAFTVSLLYDDTIIRAPELADQPGASLDDNPDANQAALGGNWDCSIFELNFPTGDKNAATGPQAGDASIFCWNMIGPYPFTSTGIIASVIFTPVARGTSTLSLANVVLGDSTGVEIGSCNPLVGVEIACGSASITIQ